MVRDGVLASLGVDTEPSGVSRLAARETPHVSVGVSGISLGVHGGGSDLLLPERRAADVSNPVVVDAGDGEGTREVNFRSVRSVGIDVLEGAITIDVGEQVRWLDGVLSRARQSEVVRRGN